MPFRYPLESILQLRRSIEHQEEKRLLAIAARVAGLRVQIEQMDQLRIEKTWTASTEMATGVCGAIVHFISACQAAHREAISRLLSALAAAEQERLTQLHAYKEARQRREVLESLRERQQMDYDRKAAHRDQQRLDDQFLRRFRANFSE